MAEKLNAILKSYVADGTATKDKLLGAAFVVVSKDGPIYQGSAGRTSLDPASAAFTPSSIAWTASLSKLITTLTLMRLVEQKQISLDEDVRPRVPELARLPILRGFATAATHPDKEEGEPILEPNTAPVGRTARADNSTVEGWSTPFMFPPGEGWYYGTGPDWAGQVLERVTGRRLSEYMNEHILRPLGVGGTGFYIHELERPVPFPVNPPHESGGAGLYTNGADYRRVLQELLRALAGDKRAREWQRRIVRGFGSAVEIPEGSLVDFGIGGILNIEDIEGKRKKGSIMWSGFCNRR
ncbi:beta-lactamase/transpeptidase-like protein [Corynascus novoguineensis]|uniref:Beta-lactamase/transpeptidase-like protein n=1 Tax=Corynascus novoguineensis TaxID=1126955 RepID=A0AAN7CM08_9PEZI|nr:beta-lactamase/transpeptidase-like protein [Corynascus novoguineensis]